jgi:hypothetical protein
MSGYIGQSPVPQSTQTRQTFTATSGQTTFATGGYQAGYLSVYLNGVKLVDGTDFTATNGSDVVLTTGAATGDTLEVVAFSTFTVANQNFTNTTTTEDLVVTGSFTSQGIDDNATSTAMTLDTSGNVLVGKTVLNATDEGIVANASGRLWATANGSSSIFNRTTSDGDILDLRKDGSTVGSIGSYAGASLSISKGSSGLLMDNSVTRVLPFNGATNAPSDGAVALGGSSNRFKDLYLSGGVYLGGTGSANKLDDYEEGTFNPTLTASSSGSITLNSGYDTCSYTKIGRQVYVSGLLVVSSVSSPSGELIFNGLPFEMANISDYAGTTRPVVMIYASGAKVGYFPTVIMFTEGGTSGSFRATFNDTYDTTIADWIGGGSDIFINFSYITY